MPIEIMELTVRARVRDEESGTADSGSSNNASSGGQRQQEDALYRRMIEIAAELLKRQKER